jgi:quercetin dioxygenase-like cupin family protein
MIKRVARGEARVYPLPGRDWLYYIGPDTAPTQNVTVGLAVFPAGSRPAGHVHPEQEETIFVTRGLGRLVTPEGTADLEPGVSVFIPMGTFHATESDGPDALELVCMFSPPVVPGSYERATGT